MQILLIGHILVRDYLWVISQVALGKLLISKLVGDGERESQDQNHNNLTMSFLLQEDAKMTYLCDTRDHADDHTSCVVRGL